MADFHPVTLPDGTVIYTDGCTGFPDQIGSHDFTTCCAVHDNGGSNGALLDCLTDNAPGFGWGLVMVLCILIMYVCRPVYELLQRVGVLPTGKETK